MKLLGCGCLDNFSSSFTDERNANKWIGRRLKIWVSPFDDVSCYVWMSCLWLFIPSDALNIICMYIHRTRWWDHRLLLVGLRHREVRAHLRSLTTSLLRMGAVMASVTKTGRDTSRKRQRHADLFLKSWICFEIVHKVFPLTTSAK
jgi:hypothetical protein